MNLQNNLKNILEGEKDVDNIKYSDLNNKEKTEFKIHCDMIFGRTVTFCETGEPLYFNEKGEMFDTSYIIEALFLNVHISEYYK